MNNKEFIIIVSLILAIIVFVFLIFSNKKETFQQDEFTKLEIKEKGSGRIVNEFNSFDGFEEILNPVNENETLNFMKMNNTSSFVFVRNNEDMPKDFSLGVYFKKKNNSARYNNFIVGQNENSDDRLFVTLDIGKIIIEYEDNRIDIPVPIDSSDDESKLSYLFLKANLQDLGGEPPT